jgi:hypothetical protein
MLSVLNSRGVKCFQNRSDAVPLHPQGSPSHTLLKREHNLIRFWVAQGSDVLNLALGGTTSRSNQQHEMTNVDLHRCWQLSIEIELMHVKPLDGKRIGPT